MGLQFVSLRLRAATQSVPILLFGLFVAIYALTAAGRYDAADGIVIADTAHALLINHTIALPPNSVAATLGVGGLGYTKYGIALTLVEIPFVAMGILIRHLTGNAQMVEWTVSFTNTFITAFACVVFYALLRRLGAGTRRGIALTLIYGLCTLAWPYAKSDFTEPLQTLSLLSAMYAAVRARQTRNMWWLVACGSALAVALNTKIVLALAVPVFVLYVLSEDLLERDRGALRDRLRDLGEWRALLFRQVALLTPILLGLAITLWFNAARFGSPLDFGYGRTSGDATFGTPIWVGVFGLVLSLNSGLIVYSTPVLLGLPGIRRFVRRQPLEALLAGLLVGVILALYASYRYWAGMAAYGPRYLVPLIPFVLLPAIDAFPGVWADRRTRRVVLVGICAIAVLGLCEQLLGVIVSFGSYSALTCTTVPCANSLNPSQAEVLYDLWLLPTSLAYNFLGHLPHVAPSLYPFGGPSVLRPNWNGVLTDRMRYFWFDWIAHPKAALAAGVVICGSVITYCATRLMRIAQIAPAPAVAPQPVGAFERTHAPILK